jgi:DNA-binding response OmpR family regulator/predicted  nucleic acid-binding Zn-ribbon protein
VSKRILLIDSDEGFAEKLSIAVQAHGFAATVATDSEQGLSMAKDESPDLIVVCVEAQPTNGYMLCTRLKKDEQLKGIPIILTSSHATADSFEKHKKLKTRAEEYLIKPFAPEAVVEKASQLLGMLSGGASGGEEEILAVEDEPLGLGDLVEGEDEPISLSAADAAEARSALTEEPLVVEEVEEVVEVKGDGDGDDELEMFDKAFDSIGSAPGASASSATNRFADLEAAPADDLPEAREPTELSAPEDDAILDSLTEGRSPPAGSRQEVARLKKELSSRNKALSALETQAQQLKDDAAKREAAAKALQQRADALASAAKKFETDARRGSGDDLKGRLAKLEKELESARGEVAALTAERDQLAEERDSLHRQLEEAQVSAGQNEDRAVKAYGRLKSDEKLREKARKALALALQLLQDSRPDEDDEEDKKVSAKA